MRQAARVSITSRPTRAAGSARVIRGCGNRCSGAGAQQHHFRAVREQRREIGLVERVEAVAGEAADDGLGGEDDVGADLLDADADPAVPGAGDDDAVG